MLTTSCSVEGPLVEPQLLEIIGSEPRALNKPHQSASSSFPASHPALLVSLPPLVIHHTIQHIQGFPTSPQSSESVHICGRYQPILVCHPVPLLVLGPSCATQVLGPSPSLSLAPNRFSHLSNLHHNVLNVPPSLYLLYIAFNSLHITLWPQKSNLPLPLTNSALETTPNGVATS